MSAEPLPASVRSLEERAERELALVNRVSHAVSTPTKPNIACTESSGGVELIDAATLNPEPICWLWPGWLARGKLHVLAGAPGTGKTTLAMDMAACVSSCRALPSGWKPERGNVLIWSGEDDPADTLVPRLIAAGADRTRVRFVGDVREQGECRPFDPARDVDRLAAAVATFGDVALIIVDPLVSAVAGDSHKNAEVRRGLAPLVDFAARMNAALVGITHYSKGTQGREPLERVSGSLAFGALARVVLGTVRQPAGEGEQGKMLLARCKSNIGPDDGGFSYSFEQVDVVGHPEITASRIAWGSAVEGSARELLGEAESAEDTEDRHDAAAWLTDLLTNGPMPAKAVKAQADQSGFAWRTVQRAMKRAGAESARVGFGKDARYLWRLTEHARQDPSCAPCTPNKEPGAHGAHGGAHVDSCPGDVLEI